MHPNVYDISHILTHGFTITKAFSTFARTLLIIKTLARQMWHSAETQHFSICLRYIFMYVIWKKKYIVVSFYTTHYEIFKFNFHREGVILLGQHDLILRRVVRICEDKAAGGTWVHRFKSNVCFELCLFCPSIQHLKFIRKLFDLNRICLIFSTEITTTNRFSSNAFTILYMKCCKFNKANFFLWLVLIFIMLHILVFLSDFRKCF